VIMRGASVKTLLLGVTLLMSAALTGCVGQAVDSDDDDEGTTTVAAQGLDVAPPPKPDQQQVVDPNGGDPQEDPEPSPWLGPLSGQKGGPHDPGDPGDPGDNMNPEPSPWDGSHDGDGSIIIRTNVHK